MSDSLGIPGYRQIRSVGLGASGEVFEVEELELGRRVALKLLRSQTPSAELVARFRRERELLARVTHPNVLRVHSAGSSRGRLYVVTELLPGRTVANLCAEKVEFAEACRVALEAADGLSALHAAGLVHRDVKPANLLLDETGVVKVADLGLATGEDLHSLTAAGELMGSPAYMSPEGLRGKRLRDPSCDVYSLGATFFELLTGELPHQARTVLELVAARVSAPSPDPLSVAPHLPVAIAKVCQRAMAGEASERYPDAGAFAAALREALAPAPRTRPSPELAAVGLVGLLALALLVWGLGRAGQPSPNPAASPSASAASPLPGPSAITESPLSVLARRLEAGEQSARSDAQAWVRGPEPDRASLARLRDAWIRGALLAPPSQTFARRLNSPSHVPWALAQGPEQILWAEVCPELVPPVPHTHSALGLLGSDGQFEAFNWRGGQISAVESSGRYLAGWTREGEARLYQLAGRELRVLYRRANARIVALTRGPGRLAVGLERGTVLCLEPGTGEILWERNVHTGPVAGLAFNQAGLLSCSLGVPSLAASGAERGEALTWNTPAHLGSAHFLIPSPDPLEVLCGLQLSHIVYGLSPGAARSFEGRALTPRAAQVPMAGRWSPDGVRPRAGLVIADRYLVVVGGERSASHYSQQRLFELRTGAEVCVAEVSGVDLCTLTLSPDGSYLAIGGVRGNEEGVVTLHPLLLR